MSVQERVPLFYIGPRATIVDASIPTASQLQVLYQGRPVKATNVVAVMIYIWNDGKMPIRSNDVLEPISIQLDRSCDILESRILKISRRVTKFEKQEVSESAKYMQPVSFDILEKGDGAAIQIIYAGRSDATISLAGTIVGAGVPRILSEEQQSTNVTNRQKLRTGLTVAQVIVLSGSVLLILASLMLLSPFVLKKPPELSTRHFVMLLHIRDLLHWWGILPCTRRLSNVLARCSCLNLGRRLNKFLSIIGLLGSGLL
jgi:hypothetical protein